jgi:hypothetical protein
MHPIPFERAHQDEQNPIVGFLIHLVVAEKIDRESLHANEGVTLDTAKELP